MGCCHSTTATTSSERAARPSSSDPAAARPNSPIRPPSPLLKTPKNVSRHSPPWTRGIYEREIEVFFETRVTGDREVWATLKAVCEELRRGDVGGAQILLDAAGLSVPNGRVARTRSATVRDARSGERVRGGVFDGRGRVYEVPSWVVAVPRDLIDDPPAPEKDVNNSDDEEEAATEQLSPRPEKGKGRAQDIGTEQQVRIRYNDLPRDSTFVVGSRQTVSVLRRKVMEDRGVGTVRLVLMGHLLEDAKILSEVGWREGVVINAFCSMQEAQR